MFRVDDDSDMVATEPRGNSRVELDQSLFPSSYIVVAVAECWLFLETIISQSQAKSTYIGSPLSGSFPFRVTLATDKRASMRKLPTPTCVD